MFEVLTACWIRFSLFAVCFSFNVLPCFLPLAFRGDLLAMTTPSLAATAAVCPVLDRTPWPRTAGGLPGRDLG